MKQNTECNCISEQPLHWGVWRSRKIQTCELVFRRYLVQTESWVVALALI